MSKASISGWAHSKFGKLDAIDSETLLTEVAREAISHAGLTPEDSDSIHIGHFNGGFLYQVIPSSLVFHPIPELKFKPAARLVTACDTGSAAVNTGLAAIAA